MTGYLISVDDGAMNHIPDEDPAAVAPRQGHRSESLAEAESTTLRASR
jgi:hypothetical protein